MIVESAFAAVYGGVVVMTLWSLAQVRAFLRETPLIADAAGLERYKAFVRVQMHLALLAIALFLLGLLLTMLLVARRGLAGLALVLAVNAGVFVLGRYHKRWELRARGLEVTSEPLRAEYRRVSDTWVKKPLPDF